MKFLILIFHRNDEPISMEGGNKMTLPRVSCKNSVKNLDPFSTNYWMRAQMVLTDTTKRAPTATKRLPHTGHIVQCAATFFDKAPLLGDIYSFSAPGSPYSCGSY